MSIQKITKEEFEAKVLKASQPVIVEFSAPWCVYCRRLAPVLERMAEKPEMPPVFLVDIDEQPELAKEYAIEVIPTLLLFKNGTHGESIVAPGSQAQVQEWIDKQN